MKEFVKSFSPLEIVEQGLDGHTGTDENRRSAQDLGIAMHDRRDTLHGAFPHDCFNIIPAALPAFRDMEECGWAERPSSHDAVESRR